MTAKHFAPTFRPLLASPVPDNLEDLRFPLLASPKYDGIRALVRDGVLVSRNLKPIPNRALQAILGQPAFDGLDGELIWGDPGDPACFKRSSSGTKADGDIADCIFFAFDCIRAPNQSFVQRFAQVKSILGGEQVMVNSLGISRPKHVQVRSVKELLDLEKRVTDMGFEGVMLRAPEGVYKFGRSTANEQILLKLKRFEHDEAQVLGAYEQMENTNEAKIGELGQTKRSTSKAGKVGKGILGGFHCKMINGHFKGVEFDCGTGWTDAERDALWRDWKKNTQAQFQKKMGYLRVKHQLSGASAKPRFPIADGWRSPGDLS